MVPDGHLEVHRQEIEAAGNENSEQLQFY